MGNSTSRVVGCFVPAGNGKDGVNLEFLEPLDEGLGHSFCYVRPVIVDSPAITPSNSERYTVDSSTFDSETHSGSFRQEIVEELAGWNRSNKNFAETTFKTISGASVSANASTARTPNVLLTGDAQEPAALFESSASFAAIPLQPVPRGSGPLNGFMSGPLERGFASGPLERGSGLMSGPLDKGTFLSGPLDSSDRNNFSAPLGYERRRGIGRLMRSMSRPMRSALSRTFMRRSQGPGWMQRLFFHSKEEKFQAEVQRDLAEVGPSEPEYSNSRNLQWAHGRAGEDRIYDGFSGPDAPDFLMSNLYKAIDKELEGLLWDYEDKSQKTPIVSGPMEREAVEALSEIVAGKCFASQIADDEVEKDHESLSSCNECSQEQCEEGVATTQLNEGESRSKLTLDTSLGHKSIQDDEVLEEKDSTMVIDQVQATSEISENYSANITEKATSTINDQGEDAIGAPATISTQQSRKSKRLYELLQLELVEDREAKESKLASVSWNNSQSCAESTKVESSGRTEGADSPRESDGVENSEQRKHMTSFSSLGHKQMMKRSIIGSKLRKMYRRQKTLRKKLFPWSYDWHREEHQVDEPMFNPSVVVRRCKSGPVDHDAVLSAMTQALANTEEAYMEMVEMSLDRNPELALMGSCVLVMLMKDQDVYVMNLGDSRVILAQDRLNDRHVGANHVKDDARNRNRSRESLVRVELDRISEESPMHNPNNRVCGINKNKEISLCRLKTRAVQLSSDHCTGIEEEVSRIKAEHVDDVQAILNDRVKGQLKVTRAFGAGFLKKPKFNDALLEMFRIDYIGSSPYLSCIPSVLHHRLCSNDRFLVLSSDGLYQYFSNEEVVSHVAWFMENVPEGDPAQYLISELLFRAAKMNGMDFHELLDIPHGDRRKYHDDVSVMVISLEGRIWRSSG
ncbi:uncharacterized protein A4U43_C07F11690 [Asparagus officinalis]|uniref:protein-serine/threonine phosphatase n=1 Tax=Asparagus officinalis TaxID=4686 RepID=A0A5P1ED53_ASPOF|nr:protein phosphatase 2C 32 [Asparagus officinalis]ONK63127.1 uncharacterized protein A4U43_C07F11690 [Asparagus officinalis]